ncbi:MAG: flippase-like domain-containing protein [Desulfurococcales archaeon]|nr:flippase-like domain-containing protein [Desulfurococcales archaeon]
MKTARVIEVDEARAIRYLLAGGLLLVVLSLIGVYMIIGGIREVLVILRNMDPLKLALGVIFIILGETVRAVRLKLIARVRNASIPLTGALIARLLGRFAGILTPASMASTPVRAGVIGSYTGLSLGESVAISISETIYDTFIPVLIAMSLGIIGLPDTWPILAISVIIAGLWAAGLSYARTPGVEEAVARYTGRRDLWCFARRQRILFLETLKSNMDQRLIATSMTLTLLAHSIESLAIGVILDWSQGLIWWLMVLETSYVMTMTPTPGGALLFELGLNIVLTPTMTVEWRTLFVIASLLPGIVIVTLIPKLRVYLYQIASSIGECEEGESNTYNTLRGRLV